jgi:hypothetical protein
MGRCPAITGSNTGLPRPRSRRGGALNSMTTGGRTYFYLTDAIGSVVALADADGNKVNSYAYSPRGVRLVAQSYEPVAQPYRFACDYQDPTGLYRPLPLRGPLLRRQHRPLHPARPLRPGEEPLPVRRRRPVRGGLRNGAEFRRRQGSDRWVSLSDRGSGFRWLRTGGNGSGRGDWSRVRQSHEVVRSAADPNRRSGVTPMRQSKDWTVLAYKGLGGAPMWVVIGLLVTAAHAARWPQGTTWQPPPTAAARRRSSAARDLPPGTPDASAS